MLAEQSEEVMAWDAFWKYWCREIGNGGGISPKTMFDYE